MKNLSSASAATKKFDPKLHEEDDGPAKDVVMRYIFQKWHLEPEEGGQYDVDIVLTRDGREVGFAEVERRHNWVSDFPYNTVHVPHRKLKFFTLDLPTLLFSVKEDLSQALWCRGDTIIQSPLVENPNKYVASGEKFYAVPLRLWRLVNL